MSTKQPTAAAGEKPAAKKAKPLSEMEQIGAINVLERAARQDLASAQADLGRVRRLEKAARKDPAVADILDQNKAQAGVIAQLRATNAAQAEDLAKLREQLAAALKPKE